MRFLVKVILIPGIEYNYFDFLKLGVRIRLKQNSIFIPESKEKSSDESDIERRLKGYYRTLQTKGQEFNSCPVNFVRAGFICFHVSQVKADWFAAQRRCNALGGRLMAPLLK